MFGMSVVWLYPASLLWATEYRTDWLAAQGRPGSLIVFLYHGALCRGTWLQIVRRFSLLIWQVGFIGFLAISDSTFWFLHMVVVNIFAAALLVYSLATVGGPWLGDTSSTPLAVEGSPALVERVTAQLVAIGSALLGLVAFQLFNAHQVISCVRAGVGYWFWFAEVWALVSVLWFTPARLFCDEQSPTTAFIALSAICIGVSLVVGIVPLLPELWRKRILPSGIAQRLQ